MKKEPVLPTVLSARAVLRRDYGNLAISLHGKVR